MSENRSLEDNECEHKFRLISAEMVGGKPYYIAKCDLCHLRIAVSG